MRVGTWIDGRPIYEEIVTQENVINENIKHNIQNFDNIWLNEANSFLVSEKEVLPINWFYGSSDGFRTILTNQRTEIAVRSLGNFNSGFKGYYALRYTLK